MLLSTKVKIILVKASSVFQYFVPQENKAYINYFAILIIKVLGVIKREKVRYKNYINQKSKVKALKKEKKKE